jgi:hypothetical protein
MAQSESDSVTDVRDTMKRPQAQVVREAALREVADTLRNIEQAIRRAYHAQSTVRIANEPDLEAALRAATEQLEAARRELVQSAYFNTDDPRLF